MSERNCAMAREAIVRIDAHEKHCAKREQDIDTTIVRIFDRLDAITGRWLAVAGVVILAELGLIGFLCQKLLFA